MATVSESEWQTRKQRIDAMLRCSNPPWKIIRYHDGLDLSALHCCAVEEFPTTNGPADYALFVFGKLLAIIEAKKITVNPQNVLEQAKRYAAGATCGPGNWNGLRVPFLYSTNGEIIWHLDVRAEKPTSRTISHFHTAPAMEERFNFDAEPARRWLLASGVQLSDAHRPPRTGVNIDDAAKRYAAGASLADLADEFNVGINTMKRRLELHGVVMRSRGPRPTAR